MEHTTSHHLFYFTTYSYVFSIAIIVCLYVYIHKIGQNKQSFIEILLIYLLICTGKPIKELERRYFRIIYASMMVVAFYGYTLFNIQIISALALHSCDLGVKSIKQFAQTDYKIYSIPTLIGILNQSLQNVDESSLILSRIQTAQSEQESTRTIKDIIINCSNHAIICDSSTAEYFKDLSYLQNKEFCFETVSEAIVPGLVTFVLSYRSPFLDKFNEALARIIEGGLVANYTKNTPSLTGKLKNDFEPYGMKKPREKFPWKVYVVGISLAFIAFIGEILFMFICTIKIE